MSIARKLNNESMRKHKLMTKELREALPDYRETAGQGDEAIAQVKYFTPDSSWTWFATEFDENEIFFGLVFGHETELGSFSLAEMEEARGPMGSPIERDLYWKPRSLAVVKREMAQRGYQV